MNEADDLFKAFKEGAPPATTEDKPAKKTKSRKSTKARSANGGVGADATKPSTAGTGSGKIKKTRKPRQKRELKLPLSTLLALGNLSAEESSVVQSMAIGFADFSKKSRGRIVAALSKIFA